MMKKLEYYDDPLLYSSDEETRKALGKDSNNNIKGSDKSDKDKSSEL